MKSGVRHASARLDHLEPLVRKAVLDAFMFGPESIVPEITRVDITLLQNRLEAIRSARQEILDLIRDGLTTNADARSQLKELRDDEEQTRSSIEEARAASTSAHMLIDLRRDLWPTVRIDWSRGFDMAVDLRLELNKRFDALPIEDRRGLVETLLDIRVHPGRGIEKYEVTHSVVTHLNPCVESHRGRATRAVNSIA